MINIVKGLLGIRSVSSPICSNDRKTKWITDIEFIEKELPKRHKNLFYKVNKKDFYRDITEIKEKIENVSDNELIVTLMKIIASVQDGHTKLLLNNDKKYPFEFFFFDDGIFLTKSLETHSDYIGSKLTHINNKSIEVIVKNIQKCVSYDNHQQFKNRIVKYLCVPEILNGLGIIEDYRTSFRFQTQSGEYIDLVSDPCDEKESGLLEKKEKSSIVMLHLLYQHKNYWYDFDETDGILYFQYNSCVNAQDFSFRKFNLEMFQFIDKRTIKKLVVDMRHNGGGNSMILNPFFKALKKRPHLNKYKTLYVIIGRETFSSALLNAINFMKKTNATLVGEPTGGKPNHFGEIMYLNLSNTNLEIMYSTQYFKNIKNELDSIEPNIPISLNSVDYFNNVDRALQALMMS
jgi:hypothetical protein